MTVDHSSGGKDTRLQLLTALRESEMLREMAELLASSLNLEHILQVLTKRTTEVCEIERCTVWLLEESHNHFRPAAYHVSSTHISHERILAADAIWFRSPMAGDNEVIARLLTDKGMLFVEDLRKEPSMRAMASTFLVQSVLLIALVREGRTVGMMTLDNPDSPYVFSLPQQQLARAIGQQAAVAIDNARLYEQAQSERRRVETLIERASAVNQIALAVNSGKDLQSVLEIATQNLVRCLEADSGATALLESGVLKLATITPPVGNDDALPQSSIDLESLPICQQAARQGVPIFQSRQQAGAGEKSWYRQLGLENFLIVPLMVGDQDETPFHQQHCVGLAFVNYQHTSQRPTRGNYAFAQDIAAQCALAIEKTHLLAKAHEVAELAMEQANTLSAVFQTMTEAICVFNHEGEIVWRNLATQQFIPQEIQNKAQFEALIEKRPLYPLHNEHEPLAFQNIPLSRAFRGEYVRGERFLSFDAHGNEIAFEMNASPMIENGRQLGVVSAFREITDQIHTERYIRHALETMLQVAEDVSGITRIDDILHKVLAQAMRALNCQRGMVMRYQELENSFISMLSINFDPADQEYWLARQNAWLHTTVSQDHALQTHLKAGHAMLSDNRDFVTPDTVSYAQPQGNRPLLIAPISYNNHNLGMILLDQSPGRTAPLSIPTALNAQRSPFSIWDMAVIEGITQLTGLAISQNRWQREAAAAISRETAMREANSLKDEFLAITAHEFRTPLTIILTHCQAALRVLRRQGEPLAQAKRIQEGLGSIEEQTHHLTNIVNTFLEVAQINRGQVNLSLEPVNLSEIMRHVLINYQSTTTRHQIFYKEKQKNAPWLISGDTARLKQIITNLLQNAIKYSPAGGAIKIVMRRIIGENRNPMIEISIADKGIGIPKDAQARLFESFYRAPNSTITKAHGVGLGLFIVAELLKLHGGTIRVESSGQPGKGSRFIITLPTLESKANIHG
ncbi:MAG TPA: GAF domain-containing protein [Ktedonobacteraceae bacterium]|nr:GAF domain-containing protein [Ktedonobacteraceae bacterium]